MFHVKQWGSWTPSRICCGPRTSARILFHVEHWTSSGSVISPTRRSCFVSCPAGASWVDLGTGAGFPGLIVAVLHDGPVTLVEERRLRVAFLRQAAEALGVRVEILHAKAERLAARPFDVISARAFAPLEKLLSLGTAFSTQKSLWLLPKGRNASAELAALDPSWQGEFRLEPSVTDAEARIIVARGVSRTKVRRAGKDKRR